MNVKQSSTASSSAKSLIVVAILAIAWALLRIYAQSGVDAYNDCYWRVVSNTEAAKNATIAAGYSSADATNASFDVYTDQVYNCSKQRPPDWVILVTGVKAKELQ